MTRALSTVVGHVVRLRDRGVGLVAVGSLVACTLTLTPAAEAAPTPGAASTAGAEQAPASATDLRVNGADDPLGISAEGPRFSWRVTTPQRGVSLTGYRIVVSSTPAGARAGEGDLWDSGDVDAAMPGDVVYGGAPLAGATRYYWAVRPRTAAGEGDWSQVAWFETAVGADGWSGAKWIGGPGSAPATRRGAWPSGSVATSSSSHSSGNYAISKIIDGDRSSYWNDDDQGVFPDWVQVTSPAPVTTGGITVTGNREGGPRDFVVAARVGEGWTTVATVAGNDALTTYVPFAEDVTTTALRVTVSATWDVTQWPGWTRVGEIELGDTRTAGWPAGTVATASSSHGSGGYDVSKVLDGDLSTFWNDNSQGAFPDWVEVTSPQAVELPGITVVGNADGGPRDFVVTALVGGAMREVATVTGNSDLQTYVAFDAPVSTTRIRISVSATWDTTPWPGWTRVGEIHPGELPVADRSAPLLRRDFTVDRQVARARLSITGVGNFVATLNGERVGQNVLDPAFTMYNERVLFVTHDVTDLVRSGDNALGVELGRGFYGLLTDMPYWDWDNAVWHGEPRALAKLQIDYTDGTSSTIVTDDDWTTTSGPRTADSVYTGEDLDARRAQQGWSTPEFDDSTWQPAVVVDAPDGALTPQEIEPIRFQPDRRATSVTAVNPTSHVFDFGGVRTGWVRLRNISGAAGTEVQIRYGEKLDGNGNVYTDGLQTDTWTLAGTGSETFEPQFTWKSYRYVQVVGDIVAPTAADVVGRTFHTDVATVGDFSSDNELYNDIHAASTQTLVNNLTGFPTDTPMFEKNGWTGDFMLGMQFGPKTYDMERFIEKWVGDVVDAQQPNGSIPLIIPADGHVPPTVDVPWGNAPEWSAAFPTAMWTLWNDYGLASVVEEHWDALKVYLDHQLEVMGPDHITTTSLGDWVAPEASADRRITSTAYVYQSVDQAQRLAEVVGDTAAAESYARVRDDIKAAFNAAFFRSSDGWYQSPSEDSYRQASNAIPLVMGLVPAGREADVARRLDQDVRSRGNKLATGILGTAALLPALTDHGYGDTAAAVTNQRSQPSWGYWLSQGVDTLLEDWSINARSRNHYMFGSVDSWFYDDVAGISSTAPGGSELLFRPRAVGGVSEAEGRLDTVFGPAATSWRATEDGFTMDVEVPAGARAVVEVPVAPGQAVTEAGTRLGETAGVTDVTREDGLVRIEIGSGAYSFRAAAVAGVLTTSQASPTASGSFPVTLEFTDAVVGLDASDLAVDNATVSGFDGGGATYTFDVRATSDGPVEVSVPAGAATTVDGQATTDVARLRVVVDTTPPVVRADLQGRTLLLDATDATSGVREIHYRMDDGDWSRYTAPIALDSGAHVVGFRATDVVGNSAADDSILVAAAPAAAAPMAIEAPRLRGTPRVGQVLSATPGRWDQPGVVTTYSWLRDGSPIDGATDARYRVRREDVGKRMSVLVRAARPGQAVGTASSASTGPVRRAVSRTWVRLGPVRGSTVRVSVRVAASGVMPRGRVAILVRGRAVATKRLRGGRVVVRLRALSQPRAHRVVYLGSRDVNGSASRITVPRRR